MTRHEESHVLAALADLSLRVREGKIKAIVYNAYSETDNVLQDGLFEEIGSFYGSTETVKNLTLNLFHRIHTSENPPESEAA